MPSKMLKSYPNHLSHESEPEQDEQPQSRLSNNAGALIRAWVHQLVIRPIVYFGSTLVSRSVMVPQKSLALICTGR